MVKRSRENTLAAVEHTLFISTWLQAATGKQLHSESYKNFGRGVTRPAGREAARWSNLMHPGYQPTSANLIA